MSETTRPKTFQVNAARGIAEINQRLGDKTPDWILKLAAIRLPFDPPDDPVNEARVNAMKQAGQNWFGGYSLPMAILRLKQGIGRLLRTKDDRGVMAILDKRLYTKSYGAETLRALPPATRGSGY